MLDPSTFTSYFTSFLTFIFTKEIFASETAWPVLTMNLKDRIHFCWNFLEASCNLGDH